VSAPRAVIVGAGPAGLGAALVLAERGLGPVVIDEAPAPGGQGWHPEPTRPGVTPRRSASRAQGARVLAQVASLGLAIDHRPDHSAVALYPGLELVVRGAVGLASLRPEAVLLATGAHDRVLPFTGWTTPGVLSLGGLLGLLDRHGLEPVGPVVLAGAGPLLLLAAVRLVEAGHPPAAVLDCAGLADMLPALPGLLGAPGLLGEGRDLLARLRTAKVPVQRRQAVIAAQGGERLERVCAAPVDSGWRPDRGRARWFEAGLLAVGHGLAPEVSLAAQVGVAVAWDNPAGGWLPEHGPDMSTSLPGLWVAGDGCGVHGAPVAWLQGRRAGLAMAAALGAEGPDDAREARRIEGEITVALRARRGLERALQPRRGLLSVLEPDTIICRCEEVRWGEIDAWLARGVRGPTGLKMATRAGMGRCQGRFCGHGLQALCALDGGQGAVSEEPLSPRPPARPVSLGELARWQR
jgi:thioredoxin reductase